MFRQSDVKIKFINGSIITDVTSDGGRTGKGGIKRKAVMAVLPVVRTLIVESHTDLRNRSYESFFVRYSAASFSLVKILLSSFGKFSLQSMRSYLFL